MDRLVGSSSSDLKGSVRARSKEESDRREGDIPFGVSRIHVVPDRNRGPMR